MTAKEKATLHRMFVVALVLAMIYGMWFILKTYLSIGYPY
jgi:hypothetical protein